jgi:hypothetical protein
VTDPLDAELEQLVMASKTDPEETPYSVGVKDLRASFPGAVRTTAQLALYSSSEKTRYLAARFIVEKVIELETLTADDPLAKFMDEVTDFAQKHTRED